MSPLRKIELLAPAKDAAHGIAAIDYGADAVYIGAPRFGARSAAENSMEEIRRLVDYAHPFRARVYMAINTLLYDDELKRAEQIARQAWEAGVDALIVQDMAFAEMELPPIPLHASTQTFNGSAEKARFFEEAGFSRVILERALGLDEIQAIRQATDIELEAFVHGALCVCYSGQCYMSQAIAGRSGNRGECQQPCRWDYNLTGEGFKKMLSGKHLLSVNDLNLSEHLEELLDAGVNSFKIEGRLKDITYLKNNVAYYRRALDRILALRSDLTRSSRGETVHDFIPDPEKSFSRGFTDYFLKNRQQKVASFDTPKSIGQYLGSVQKVTKNAFFLDSSLPLSNGDGICFTAPTGQWTGTNINKTEGHKVYPNKMEGLAAGTRIYRNYDHAFGRSLERSKTRRSIALDATLLAQPNRLTLRLTDPEAHWAERSLRDSFDPAQNPAKADETIRQQLTKTGDTIFRIKTVGIEWETPLFIPASVLNTLRRETLEALTSERAKSYPRELRRPALPAAVYPERELSYLGNVTNRLSEAFYRKHGVNVIEPGFELQSEYQGKSVMRTKYCIRREIGQCLRQKGCSYRGPLQLENNFHIFALEFDCVRCEMSLIYRGKRK